MLGSFAVSSSSAWPLRTPGMVPNELMRCALSSGAAKSLKNKLCSGRRFQIIPLLGQLSRMEETRHAVASNLNQRSHINSTDHVSKPKCQLHRPQGSLVQCLQSVAHNAAIFCHATGTGVAAVAPTRSRCPCVPPGRKVNADGLMVTDCGHGGWRQVRGCTSARAS